jgi:hypothetical protein
MNHAVREQKETTGLKRLRPSRAPLIWAFVICLPLVGLSVFSWIERPEAIWGAKERSVSPQRQEANLRISMFFLAQRIESYRRSQGGYPSSLDAMGELPPGIAYRVESDTAFELRVPRPEGPIVFRSRDNAAAFLGNSPYLIQGRAK